MLREVMWDFGRWLQRKSYPNPKIEFYTPVRGLEDWAPPVPSSRMIPQWYKDMPKNHEENNFLNDANTLPTGNPPEWRTTGETVKTCPGMQDIMTAGYTVPLWGAILLETTEDGEGAASITSSQKSVYSDGTSADYMKVSSAEHVGDEFLRHLRGTGFSHEKAMQWKDFQHDTIGKYWDVHSHPQHQYSEMLKTLPENYCKAIIKIVSPWRIKTPPGFSTLILPCPYEFNDGAWETLPGMINTDVYSTFNLFIALKEKGAKYMIPFGEKMCQWIPFPRYQLPHEVRVATAEDHEYDKRLVNAINANWGSSRGYRRVNKIDKAKQGGKCPYS